MALQLDHDSSETGLGHYDGIEGWERSETNTGIPYYVNHYTERTQWDHPNFVKVMESLDSLNNIKYAAYRAAMKLRVMQKFLKTIITDIYLMTKRMMPRYIDVALQSDQLLNWILNLYDMGRTGCLRVLSVKIGLTTMCSAKLTDKYRYLFHQISDSSGIVSRKQMTTFLQDMAQVVDAVYESASFQGFEVYHALSNVFESCMGSALTEDRLMAWLLAEPETLVWFPTMHRLATSETMKHEVKCNICKAYPVVGFRYKCLKCFNFDLCQECFFTNRTSKSHKYTHPVQEFVVSASTTDDAKAFAKTVRNRFSKKHRRKFKPNYLPIPPTSDYDSSYETDLNRSDSEMHDKIGKLSRRLAEVEAVTAPHKINRPQQTDNSLLKGYIKQWSAYSSRTSLVSANEIRELKTLISHLEGENRSLLRELEAIKRREVTESETSRITVEHWREEHEELKARQEILQEHNKQLELVVQRLRLLLIRENKYPSHTTSMVLPQPARSTSEVGKQMDKSAPAKLTPTHQHISQSSSGIVMTDSREQQQISQSSEGIDMTDGRRLPPHLANQSSIHFPPNNASKLYMTEEAQLDDLLNRLSTVYPLNASNASFNEDTNEMIFAVRRVGEAMTSLVSRATKQYDD
ncbi:dystrophin-like isoform X2 [Ptychodera flava]|uniref:dystrophin-like isoform X2 n=1 Tax=Ptychodera flava TaxID=63121 RepID=UPI00396A5E9F